MAIWSWTKLRAARRCKLAPHLEHVKDVPKSVSKILHIGRDHHSVLEEAVRMSRMGDIPQPLSVVAEHLRTEHAAGAWPHAMPMIFDRIEETLSAVPIPEAGEKIVLEKKYLVDEVGDLEDDGIPSSEAFCSGLVDYCVYGPDRLVVRDWKTYFGEGDDDDLDQAILYAGMVLAWIRDEGLPLPNRVDVGIARPLRPRASEYAAMDREQLEHRYKAILEEMRSMNSLWHAEPEHTFGDHCATCFVSSFCPKYQENLRAPDWWEDDADAWAMRAVLKAELDRVDEHLRKAVHAQGRVPIGKDRFLRFQTSTTTGLDAVKAWPILKREGISTTSFLDATGLSVAKMKKLIKDPEVRKEIMSAASYVKGERKTFTTKPEPNNELDDPQD